MQLKKYQYLLIPTALVVGIGLGYLIAYVTAVMPSYIPVVSALIGLIVAFSVPLWQALFVNIPKLSVEINSIKRTIAPDVVVSIDDDPELRVLKSQDESNVASLYRSLFFNPRTLRPSSSSEQSRSGAVRSYTLTDIDDLTSSRKQRLRDLPTLIDERKKDLDRANALAPTTLTKSEVDQLNRPLNPEINFDPERPQDAIEEFRKAYKNRLDELEKQYTELQSNLPAAERKIEMLRKELTDNRSFFTISASLINSGRSNTAIKVPALLRVSIGEGNYIDIKLTLKDFEEKSEISANGTRIIIFESSEVSSMPEEDRKLISTYWGQSVSARLLLEDIHSTIYSSNTIAFAEGLYQKIIYDRLARAAAAY